MNIEFTYIMTMWRTSMEEAVALIENATYNPESAHRVVKELKSSISNINAVTEEIRKALVQNPRGPKK